VGLEIIALNYLFYLPWVITLVMPVAMLLATMFSLGRLVGDNEITAIKASGISLYRVLFPLYVFALFVGLLVMVFAEIVVPGANLQQKQIEEYVDSRRHGDFGVRYSFTLFSNRERDRDNVFLANGDGRIIYTKYYSARSRTAESVFIINPAAPESGNGKGTGLARILSRIDADSMAWANNQWVLYNAVQRSFLENGVTVERFPTLVASFVNRKPFDFARVSLQPESMNFLQLRDYIQSIKDKGGDASEWLVDLYLKIAFPFVSLVIVFFGAPMVAGSVKRNKAASFGLALIISFVFYAFINIFQVLGRSQTVDPLIAAWISNMVFFILGIVMHIRASK
jgi:lipopolysaccharide export system permease protein